MGALIHFQDLQVLEVLEVRQASVLPCDPWRFLRVWRLGCVNMANRLPENALREAAKFSPTRPETGEDPGPKCLTALGPPSYSGTL